MAFQLNSALRVFERSMPIAPVVGFSSECKNLQSLLFLHVLGGLAHGLWKWHGVSDIGKPLFLPPGLDAREFGLLLLQSLAKCPGLPHLLQTLSGEDDLDLLLSRSSLPFPSPFFPFGDSDRPRSLLSARLKSGFKPADFS